MSDRAMECIICHEIMTAPILNCQRGHSSSCSRCIGRGITNCPLCRSPMTDGRNFALENLIEERNTPAPPTAAASSTPAAPSAKLLCPHKDAGCGFTFSQAKARELEEHSSECIFRDMLCPLFMSSSCNWTGKLKIMMDHFKEAHASSCNITSGVDTDLELPIDQDMVKVYLTATGYMLHFIITMKVDKTAAGTVSWAVQHIGSKKNARLYTYEIHVTSKQDARRRAVLVDHCVNDVVEPLRLRPPYTTQTNAAGHNIAYIHPESLLYILLQSELN